VWMWPCRLDPRNKRLSSSYLCVNGAVVFVTKAGSEE